MLRGEAGAVSARSLRLPRRLGSSSWRSYCRLGSAQNGRDLPWRKTRDPYAILVCEVMLQQTQVERVIPRWLAWLERWPTPAALAAASPADVIREWQGLGYNRRARQPPPRGPGRRRPDGWPDDLTDAPGRRPLHGGRDPQPGVRRAGASGRHERRPDPGANRAHSSARRAAGALRSRRDRVPRSRAPLRCLPARRAAARRAGAGTSRCGSSPGSRGRSASGGQRCCGWSPPRRSRSRRSTGKRSTRSCGTASSSRPASSSALPA